MWLTETVMWCQSTAIEQAVLIAMAPAVLGSLPWLGTMTTVEWVWPTMPGLLVSFLFLSPSVSLFSLSSLFSLLPSSDSLSPPHTCRYSSPFIPGPDGCNGGHCLGAFFAGNRHLQQQLGAYRQRCSGRRPWATHPWRTESWGRKGQAGR